MVPVSAFSNTESSHAVQFYETDEALLNRLSEFAGSALGGGGACIIVATRSHARSLELRLLRRGLDLDQMEGDGRFQLLDAGVTLDSFMRNGEPDELSFFAIIEEVLSKASASVLGAKGRVAVFGEMVALLRAEGKTEMAIRLEQMWNRVGKRHPFSLLCAYPMQSFSREEDQIAFKHICAEHTHLLPCESYGELLNEPSRLQKICELQQRSQMLQGEMSRRKKAEEALKNYEYLARFVN